MASCLAGWSAVRFLLRFRLVGRLVGWAILKEQYSNTTPTLTVGKMLLNDLPNAGRQRPPITRPAPLIHYAEPQPQQQQHSHSRNQSHSQPANQQACESASQPRRASERRLRAKQYAADTQPQTQQQPRDRNSEPRISPKIQELRTPQELRIQSHPRRIPASSPSPACRTFVAALYSSHRISVASTSSPNRIRITSLLTL